MFLIKSAWDNIKFHKKRSILSILLIAIASAAILLYRGFVEYSEQGMAIGFIQESGHIQAAVKDFWDKKNTADLILTSNDLNKLKNVFEKIPEIENFDSVLNFQGIIGTENSSSIFWGSGYDEPHSLGAAEGVPVFEGDNTLVLGKGLFKSLGLNLENDNYVNIMSSMGEEGIAAGSFEVSGNIDTGVPQNDAGFLIASRKDILEFFGMPDTASYIRLYLKNDKDVEKVESKLNSIFKENNLNFEGRNWKTLNPSWQQISNLFNVQFTVISGILCVLIFVALTQSLSASFMERIGEFGTMEAIGLKKSLLILVLILEVCILSLAGIIGGILLSQAGNIITQTFDIKMNPPGSTSYYLLNFFITAKAVIKTQIFIFFTALISVIYPIYTIKKHSSIKLINYNIS
ncbi:ABC transporter permease [Treponema sp. OMZ 787]|uniref:ABC transporter permease n=1 Tax=Treponema sp. OMZ 787 TaxID=2563669 RepID=UPI0020A373D0|nr:FtsX-like permease family protein [Treponema sp. OMZ 787]UTC62542.1 ABC transporter permease [Treponema sp. OMZ 787]